MRKLKLFTDNYTKKYEDLDRNLGNIGKNINIIEFEYNNVSNRLKNISIKRFVEHIVEDDLKQDELPTKIKETPIIFSKEERERNILNKFKDSISKSLENLNIRNLIDIKEQNEGISLIDDDNISVSSSKYFSNFNKNKNLNLKLPYIIGTIDYFKNEYLGIFNNTSILSNLGNTSMNSKTDTNNFSSQNHNGNILNELNYNNPVNLNKGIYKDENLEKLNMNIIEQIYDKKNSFIVPNDEDQLNEILNKNKKFNHVNHKTQEINPLNNQLNNDYNKTILIKDPNFIDFTNVNANSVYNTQNNKMNDFIQENEKNLFAKDNYFENKENNLLNKNDQITDTLQKEVESNLFTSKNIFDTEKNGTIEDKNNRKINLDKFLKKNTLFDNNLFASEDDDDNTGLFNKKKESKFSLILNTKSNLFNENEEKKITLEKENNNILYKSNEEVQKDKNETNKNTDDLLITNKKIEQENILKENLNNNFDYENIIEINDKNINLKSKNSNLAPNLFSDSLLDENQVTNTHQDKSYNKYDKILNKDKHYNKLSLLSKLFFKFFIEAKNSLKILFNEDEEDENDIFSKKHLDEVKKINEKSSNLAEKLNNILSKENEKKNSNTDILENVEDNMISKSNKNTNFNYLEKNKQFNLQQTDEENSEKIKNDKIFIKENNVNKNVFEDIFSYLDQQEKKEIHIKKNKFILFDDNNDNSIKNDLNLENPHNIVDSVIIDINESNKKLTPNLFDDINKNYLLEDEKKNIFTKIQEKIEVEDILKTSDKIANENYKISKDILRENDFNQKILKDNVLFIEVNDYDKNNLNTEKEQILILHEKTNENIRLEGNNSNIPPIQNEYDKLLNNCNREENREILSKDLPDYFESKKFDKNIKTVKNINFSFGEVIDNPKIVSKIEEKRSSIKINNFSHIQKVKYNFIHYRF